MIRSNNPNGAPGSAQDAEEEERGFDLELSARYVGLQDEARALCQEIESIAAEADERSEPHPGILEALKRSSLSRLMVPRQYGGRYEALDPLAICLVREVLMGTSSHADSLFALQGIGSYAITAFGTPDQQSEWLPRVAAADVLPALALTEPEAGSDLKSITTTLVPDGEGLRLDGAKAFISNAGAAGYYLVFAKEGSDFSMVLVPADAPGVSVEPSPELMAPHVLGDVRFDNVAVPATARLGEPGEGLNLVLSTLGVFRASVAGAALGLAQAALEEAVRHTRTRHQFGRPLARLGPVAQMLADSWTELEMARLLTYRAASLAGHDPQSSLHISSMAKLGASEMASRVVDRCVQMMGRWGLIRGSKIERLYRQARPMRIYEGASEVLRLGIASQLTREVQ
ncbi:acyl-CoA dehydrogenase family protein [Elongatibacter sediminis]|uniref:Medium-chain specific acyl-CoA dehydrogenase, mitochondrial n=1 Tax=Elongatibacter sediminis TaxID=3119006 RepID=A0AAW9REF5_9GAMM